MVSAYRGNDYCKISSMHICRMMLIILVFILEYFNMFTTLVLHSREGGKPPLSFLPRTYFVHLFGLANKKNLKG